MKIQLILTLVSGIVGYLALPALAEYTVVLKNGRRITVQSYREEGQTIKIHGLGGELGIPKDQIQSIQKAGAGEAQGLNVRNLGTPSPQPLSSSPSQSPSRPSEPQSPGSAEDAKETVSSEEQQEYQKRLAEITKKLENAKQQYLSATQGGGSSSNVSKEGFQGWIADLGSRIRDSQKVSGGGGPSSTPPMPPYGPNYTPREKEISDLRIQIDTLQKERDSLIEEMKSKNIPTGVF